MLEALRSGRLSLGPMIDRFEEALAERVGAPVRRRGLERHGGAAPLRAPGRARARRRGRDDAVLVRRLGELRALRGRDAGLRRHRSRHAQPRPGRGRGGDHAAHEGDPRRCTSSATRPSSPSCEAIAERHGLALVEDACEALGAEYRGRPIGSYGHPAVFAFYPNKQMTTGEGGAVAVDRRRSGRC